MEFEIREQKMEVKIGVDGIFYNIVFERQGKHLPWVLTLKDVLKNQVVYMSKIDASVQPDITFAEDILRTYVLQGKSDSAQV